MDTGLALVKADRGRVGDQSSILFRGSVPLAGWFPPAGHRHPSPLAIHPASACSSFHCVSCCRLCLLQ